MAAAARSPATKPARTSSRIAAKGRIDAGPPIGVIDIGSNSVRLVVYEGLTRNLTPLFNEKVLAGLGREVLSTGLLAADAVDKALAALLRFRALCGAMRVGKVLGVRDGGVPRCPQRQGVHSASRKRMRRQHRHSCPVPARQSFPRSASYPACTGRTALSATSGAARWN